MSGMVSKHFTSSTVFGFVNSRHGAENKTAVNRREHYCLPKTQGSEVRRARSIFVMKENVIGPFSCLFLTLHLFTNVTIRLRSLHLFLFQRTLNALIINKNKQTNNDNVQSGRYSVCFSSSELRTRIDDSYREVYLL